MATTFKRICIKDETFVDGDKTQELKRGQEYITSDDNDGTVTVFASPHWISKVAVDLFAGTEQFT